MNSNEMPEWFAEGTQHVNDIAANALKKLPKMNGIECTLASHKWFAQIELMTRLALEKLNE